MNRKQKSEKRLFSIGHSNHPLEAFLKLLKMHSVEVLIDARSHPQSRHAPHFSAQTLDAAVTKIGAKYLFLGKELGGRPEGRKFYDDEGHVLYSRLAQSPSFLEGIRRLEEEIKNRRAAILCSEEDPTCCHRRLLVGRVLATRGIALDHIRGDGLIQKEEELSLKETRRSNQSQQTLFEEPKDSEWKSIQSVSQKRQRQSSLKH